MQPPRSRWSSNAVRRITDRNGVNWGKIQGVRSFVPGGLAPGLKRAESASLARSLDQKKPLRKLGTSNMSHSPDDYLEQFDPFRDSTDRVCEDPDDYAARMQAGPLPQWPKEVLVEWLHRHNRYAQKYTFLGFENLSFRCEVWPLNSIPGQKAFYHPGACYRGVWVRQDWPARYMVKHGTWNTPVILLENPDASIQFPNGKPMKSPFHLLEGHKRLSYLTELREIDNKAAPEHRVWIATWNGRYAT